MIRLSRIDAITTPKSCYLFTLVCLTFGQVGSLFDS